MLLRRANACGGGGAEPEPGPAVPAARCGLPAPAAEGPAVEGRPGPHPGAPFAGAFASGGRGVGFAVDGRLEGRARVNVGFSFRALLIFVFWGDRCL
jgi:hypothetical protein